MTGEIAQTPGIRVPEGVKLPDGTIWDGHSVALERFEGPLDLLLFLIREKKMAIADVNLAEITEQFLQFVRTIPFDDLESGGILDSAGDFLVMAATLIQIKIRELLPAEEAAALEDEEMTRDELIRLLLEYERFKAAADSLTEKQKLREKIFMRDFPAVEPTQEEMLKVDLTKLLAAFSNVLRRAPQDTVREIARESVTIDECMAQVQERLERQEMILFEELFEGIRTRFMVISLFLALLELLKQELIVISQAEQLGPIRIIRVRKVAATSSGESVDRAADVGDGG